MAKALTKRKFHEAGKTLPDKDKSHCRIVLVGTYRGDQLVRWRGWYNFPVGNWERETGNGAVGSRVPRDRCGRAVSTKPPQLPADFSSINELWLFQGTKELKTYKAEFVGVKTREELIRDYGYPAGNGEWGTGNGRAGSPLPAAKPHGTHYALFKTELKYRHKLDNPLDCERVIVRTADFAKRSPKIASQLKAYLESSDRKDPDLTSKLPSIITRLRPEQLRVYEAAVQDNFFNLIIPDATMQYALPKRNSYRIVSLFAGCGGLDLGFLGGFDFLGRKFDRNNFDVVWANELNPNACKTYERNLGSHIVCGDIREAINHLPDNVDVVMGGFPCQDISINGKMAGISGKRSGLYSYIVEAVKRCRPKVFLAENVGSLMLKQHEHSFKTILADFEALDYNVTYKVYHAEQYGVPQTRERIIFVGTRKDVPEFKPPEPIPGRPITCGDALRDLEDRPADKEFSHMWSVAAPSGEQGSRKMIEDRPGYTIRAECHGNIQFHYKLPRRLSMREAARIQSFPDSFLFPCGIRETERQIGNAVPPVLAWYIARNVQRVLEEAK